MATHQDILYRLSDRIGHLADLFECDENGDDIFTIINQINADMQEIMDSQKRQENLMNLIIKLLSKDEK